MPATMHSLVTGRVQGVAFRAFVRHEASGLGVTGWVRNLADGRVEVLAQGDSQTLAEFEQRLRQGPLLARVDSVESIVRDSPESFEDFQVRR